MSGGDLAYRRTRFQMVPSSALFHPHLARMNGEVLVIVLGALDVVDLILLRLSLSARGLATSVGQFSSTRGLSVASLVTIVTFQLHTFFSVLCPLGNFLVCEVAVLENSIQALATCL